MDVGVCFYAVGATSVVFVAVFPVVIASTNRALLFILTVFGCVTKCKAPHASTDNKISTLHMLHFNLIFCRPISVFHKVGLNSITVP